MFARLFFLTLVGLAPLTGSGAFSLLTYNVAGNAAADWSTNAPQVQAIGRQMRYLQPDIITFTEIPFTNSWQMANFVTAYLPGFFLATNSGTDGFERSVIASRYPIVRSQKWLDGASLASFGYNGTFTRDLFEAEINVPGWLEPLHVFVTHLKASNDANSAARRAAEASAISNFFVTAFLPASGHRTYVLCGDLNEDIARPPAASLRPIQRLVNPATDLRLTTPVNPVTSQELTFSIRSALNVRFDYILPCGLLFSNLLHGQVFRTDLLLPTPPALQPSDVRTASDHLPVMMTFGNPYDGPFRLTSLAVSNQFATLSWESVPNRRYRVDASSNLVSWFALATNLTAITTHLNFQTDANATRAFFRVYRVP